MQKFFSPVGIEQAQAWAVSLLGRLRYAALMMVPGVMFPEERAPVADRSRRGAVELLARPAPRR